MKKKMRKIRKVTALVICLTLLILTACGKQQEEADYAEPLYGTWQTDVDVTEEAIQAAEAWLGHDVDLSGAMPKLTVRVTFIFNTDGTCERTVSEESWAVARLTAEAVLADALTELTQARLIAAGVGVTVNPAEPGAEEGEEPEAETTESDNTETEPDTEALIEETFGMSAADYITRLGLELLPDYETICERYAFQGSYSADENSTLILKAADGTEETVSFLAGNGSLVFTTEMNGFSAPVLFAVVE